MKFSSVFRTFISVLYTYPKLSINETLLYIHLSIQFSMHSFVQFSNLIHNLVQFIMHSLEYISNLIHSLLKFSILIHSLVPVHHSNPRVRNKKSAIFPWILQQKITRTQKSGKKETNACKKPEIKKKTVTQSL